MATVRSEPSDALSSDRIRVAVSKLLVLDYGSWVQALTDEQVRALYAVYKHGEALELAWSDIFGGNPPDELNTAHKLTVVASDIDPATERIIEYLAGMNVPINVVFFRYFSDDGRAYLARTWLLDETRVGTKGGGKAHGGGKEMWNEQDWYASFGEFTPGRSWEDGRQYGFVSAGGGEWFSKTLKKLPIGARVFVCIPKSGYVGVGTVTGPAERFDLVKVTVEGEERSLADLPLKAPTNTSRCQPARTRRVRRTRQLGSDPVAWRRGLDKGHVCEPKQRMQAAKSIHARAPRDLVWPR